MLVGAYRRTRCLDTLAHVLGCDEVVGGDVGTTGLESLGDGDCSGVLRIVGTGVERKAKDGDAFVLNVDVIVHQREQPFGLAVVEFGGGVEHQGFIDHVCPPANSRDSRALLTVEEFVNVVEQARNDGVRRLCMRRRLLFMMIRPSPDLNRWMWQLTGDTRPRN